jgi:outer membrane protein assembly factor BamA
VAGIVAALLLLATGLCAPASAQPQTPADTLQPARWQLLDDGEPADWPRAAPTAPADSLAHVAARVLRQLRRLGHYDAVLDSAGVDTLAGRPRVRLYADLGPRAVVGRIRISGADSLSADRLRDRMDTRPGRPLDPERLEADLAAILRAYDAAGLPLAQVRVADTRLRRPSGKGERPRIDLTLAVDEGPALRLARVAVPDEARSSPRLIARLARVDVGAPLQNYDPAAIRTRLQQSGLFARVGRPELRVTPGGDATLFVPVTDASPGTFDLVVGYLPPAGTDDGGQLVGNGQLQLRNVFGGGREFALQLDRRPAQVSLFDVRAADPFLFGRSLRLAAAFHGEQRDSTFAKRVYELEAAIRPSLTWEVGGSVRREVTRPGQAGTRILRGEQQIPRSEAFFYGATVRVHRVDRPQNPRQGIRVDAAVEQGRKRRAVRRVTAAGDTTTERRTLRQERIRLHARGYVPTFARQLVALGLDARLLRSDDYDASDLFRIGGAQTLRGYDEDRFLGRIVARALVEYRVQIDRVSYAYAFTDVGVIDTPETPELDARRQWKPGFGIGIQFGTPLGLVNVSYALSPEDPSPATGRIHLGLSLGL